MRRRLIIWTLGGLCFFYIEPARASLPQVLVDEAMADPQGSALTNIYLNPAGYSISAVQFDLQYSDPVHTVTTPSLGPAGIIAEKNLITSQPKPSWLRVLIYGLNQNPIGDGVIATVTWQMKDQTPAGRYPLAITNLVLSNPSGNAIFAQGTEGAVIVAGGSTYVPSVTGVLNAASHLSGPLAPGEIVVIRGNWLAPGGSHALQVTADGQVASSLTGTRVLFDGVPAPLVNTTPTQVSAIVPYAVDGRSETALQVEYLNYRSTPLSVPVGQSAPGIFTVDGSGSGQAAAVNSEGTDNGAEHPAARGSVLLIFATGEGQTTPPGSDGRIAGALDLQRPVLQVTAMVGGQPAEVIYAGSAGGQVAGLLQVNLRVPDSVVPGLAVPVAITVGTSSQAGVTIAIQ